MKLRYAVVLCLLPLFGSLLVAYALTRGLLTNPVFVAQYSIDASAIISRLGLFVSLLACIVMVFIRWHRQQLENVRERERSQYLKDHKRFLQRLDHEIKNPLTTLQLGLVNILNIEGLQESERQSLERMQTQIDRLRQLVMDLRSLTELEDRMVERSRLEVEPLVRSAVEAVTESSNREIEVSVQQVPWPVGSIVGDMDLLTIALSNLLNNAIKFTPEHGHIRVQITDNGQSAVIEVADNGIGIPSSEVPHVFDELFRASNTQRMMGSGMGLALVHRIVELHDGGITVRSREEFGTSITVNLPLANKL